MPRRTVETLLEDLLRSGGVKRRASEKGGGRAPNSRQHRILVAKHTKHAVFKLVSKGKSAKSFQNLLAYIAKESKNESKDSLVYTEAGAVEGGNELADLREKWLDELKRGSQRKNGLKFVHFMVSSPDGTDRDMNEAAALSFAEEAFPGHRFIATRHDDTRNPHVHFIVQNQSIHNKPLNIRKADLLNYRAVWASHSRDYGIEVEAVQRSEEGNLRLSKKIDQIKISERGEDVLPGDSPINSGRDDVFRVVNLQVDSLVRIGVEFLTESENEGEDTDNQQLRKHGLGLIEKASRHATEHLPDAIWKNKIKTYQKIYGKDYLSTVKETVLRSTPFPERHH